MMEGKRQPECEITREGKKKIKNLKIAPVTLTPYFLRLTGKSHSLLFYALSPSSLRHHTKQVDLLTSLRTIPPYFLRWDIRACIRLPP